MKGLNFTTRVSLADGPAITLQEWLESYPTTMTPVETFRHLLALEDSGETFTRDGLLALVPIEEDDDDA